MRLAFFVLLFAPLVGFGQPVNLIEYRWDEPVPDVQVTALVHDSLSSSFLIQIKTKVKSHKHLHHTETVYVVDGEGTMTVGDKQFQIKAGDLVVIPKNTFHSVNVTSTRPLKVLSTQSPHFDGSDRVWESP